jgi:hypothetical protein
MIWNTCEMTNHTIQRIFGIASKWQIPPNFDGDMMRHHQNLEVLIFKQTDVQHARDSWMCNFHWGNFYVEAT